MAVLKSTSLMRITAGCSKVLYCGDTGAFRESETPAPKAYKERMHSMFMYQTTATLRGTHAEDAPGK
jgi:hypothetical protein